MELHDVSEVVKDCGFVVFKGALEAGGSVRGINAEGQGSMPRKKIDKLVEFAKTYGAKGLAYIAIAEDGTRKSSFAKFMTEEEMDALVQAMEGKPGGPASLCSRQEQSCIRCSRSSPCRTCKTDGSS